MINKSTIVARNNSNSKDQQPNRSSSLTQTVSNQYNNSPAKYIPYHQRSKYLNNNNNNSINNNSTLVNNNTLL